MIRQLAFDLPTPEAFRREDFFVSPANATAFAAIDGWHGWPGGKMLLVDVVKIPLPVSLGVVVAVIGATVAFSLRFPPKTPPAG